MSKDIRDQDEFLDKLYPRDQYDILNPMEYLGCYPYPAIITLMSAYEFNLLSGGITGFLDSRGAGFRSIKILPHDDNYMWSTATPCAYSRYYVVKLAGSDSSPTVARICECGAEKTQSLVHSTWCPKHGDK